MDLGSRIPSRDPSRVVPATKSSRANRGASSCRVGTSSRGGRQGDADGFSHRPAVDSPENFFNIPDNCLVVNASAGISVQYGKYTFRIHDQKIIYRGDWAKEVGRK